MKIERKLVERITIVGPQIELEQARAYCEREGFWVTRSGPLRVSIRRFDQSRFRIEAEREVEEPATTGRESGGSSQKRTSVL